jgi:hypothetical protein
MRLRVYFLRNSKIEQKIFESDNVENLQAEINSFLTSKNAIHLCTEYTEYNAHIPERYSYEVQSM